MRTLGIALLIAVAAINCASTKPTPTKATTAAPVKQSTTTAKPVTTTETPAKNGTSLKIAVDSGLETILLNEDQPKSNMSASEISEAIKSVAGMVNLVAEFSINAAEVSNALESEEDAMYKASAKEEVAISKLNEELKKREAALLTRRIMKASNDSSKRILEIRDSADEWRSRSMMMRSSSIPTTVESINKALDEILPEELKADQASLEIRQIKLQLLENAELRLQEETLDEEIKNEKNSHEQMVLDRKKAAIQKEREAKGAELRNRLTKLVRQGWNPKFNKRADR